MRYLYVAIFGALGTAARFGISNALEADLFPYGTLLINILGCFLLAVTLRYLATFSMVSKALITGLGTGLIGSFTTFSALSVQTANLILDRHYLIAGSYIAASLAGGFLSAALGVRVSNRLIAGKEPKQDD